MRHQNELAYNQSHLAAHQTMYTQGHPSFWINKKIDLTVIKSTRLHPTVKTVECRPQKSTTPPVVGLLTVYNITSTVISMQFFISTARI
jgi:hypothetical protein